jgi:hypothetical protein
MSSSRQWQKVLRIGVRDGAVQDALSMANYQRDAEGERGGASPAEQPLCRGVGELGAPEYHTNNITYHINNCREQISRGSDDFFAKAATARVPF